MQQSLPELQKALKGLVVMSGELEAVGKAIALNTVPESWEAKVRVITMAGGICACRLRCLSVVAPTSAVEVMLLRQHSLGNTVVCPLLCLTRRNGIAVCEQRCSLFFYHVCFTL